MHVNFDARVCPFAISHPTASAGDKHVPPSRCHPLRPPLLSALNRGAFPGHRHRSHPERAHRGLFPPALFALLRPDLNNPGGPIPFIPFPDDEVTMDGESFPAIENGTESTFRTSLFLSPPYGFLVLSRSSCASRPLQFASLLLLLTSVSIDLCRPRCQRHVVAFSWRNF